MRPALSLDCELPAVSKQRLAPCLNLVGEQFVKKLHVLDVTVIAEQVLNVLSAVGLVGIQPNKPHTPIVKTDALVYRNSVAHRVGGEMPVKLLEDAKLAFLVIDAREHLGDRLVHIAGTPSLEDLRRKPA